MEIESIFYVMCYVMCHVMSCHVMSCYVMFCSFFFVLICLFLHGTYRSIAHVFFECSQTLEAIPKILYSKCSTIFSDSFEVYVNGKLLYSKLERKEFPPDWEVSALIRKTKPDLDFIHSIIAIYKATKILENVIFHN